MKQKVIIKVEDLLSQSLQAFNGATQFGAGLLEVNTAARIGADRTGFVTALANYKRGGDTLTANRAILSSVTLTSRVFEKNVRDLLQSKLGHRYSAAWDVVGFTTQKLAIPTSPAAVTVLLEGMKAYLTAHEEAQVEELNLTPDRADSLLTDLENAQTSVNNQRGTMKQLRQTRDSAEVTLRKRLRGLVAELEQKLDPMDGLWLKFGLNLPGLKEIPAVPTNVSAELIRDTAVRLKWDRAARAQHYRVWKKVVGVDVDFVVVGSPKDRGFTIDGLPGNSTIELVISAVNNGGESGKSTVVTVTTR